MCCNKPLVLAAQHLQKTGQFMPTLIMMVIMRTQAKNWAVLPQLVQLRLTYHLLYLQQLQMHALV